MFAKLAVPSLEVTTFRKILFISLLVFFEIIDTLVSSFNFLLYKSVGLTVNGDQIPFRSSSTPMGQDIAEFTGDKRVSNLGWNRDGQIEIEQTQPLPMTVLGITGTLVTSD